MIIPVLIIAAVIGLDQISKYIVAANMQVGESFNLVKYILNIRYTENEGASFGILRDNRWIFMILSVIAIILMCAAILYLRRKNIRKNNFLISVALSLMLGGGIGNMIDRIFRSSAVEIGKKVVVDFLEFAFVNFAIFNVADSFICIGSVLFCICIVTGKYSIFEKPDKINDAGEIGEINEETGETEEINSDGAEH